MSHAYANIGFVILGENDVVHNPYNSYATAVTSSTITVVWDGVWSSSSGFNVYFDTQISPSGWALANTSTIATTIRSFVIPNLTASTAYKIKVQDAGIGAGCEPIELLVSTIAAS